MIKLLSDQENDVDRREEAFGKRAVGKCRDCKQPSGKEQQTIQKKRTHRLICFSFSLPSACHTRRSTDSLFFTLPFTFFFTRGRS